MDIRTTKRQKVDGIENLPYQLHNIKGISSIAAGTNLRDNKVFLFEVLRNIYTMQASVLELMFHCSFLQICSRESKLAKVYEL
jgi:hypothetical protein